MHDSVKQLIEQIHTLPTLPSIAERILSLVNTDDTSTTTIVETIEEDPAISSKVIGVANAALFRTGNPVATVRDAVMRIGFTTVRSIALSISMLTILKPPGQEQQKRYRHLFRHSVAVGIIARDISLRLRWRSNENTFTAGVLHDLGLIVLNIYAPDLFTKLLEGAARGGYLDTLEEKTMGISHGEVGALIAERWQLPAELHDAIRYHHAPSRAARYRLMVALIHVSDAIASRSGIPPLPTKLPEAGITPDALLALGIKAADLSEMEDLFRSRPIPDLAALA
jgi:putative nucleotidyltransferase with HDIG domain